jgi:hypothetical protein
LPAKLPPAPRLARLRRVIYELAPEIACFGASCRPELSGEPKTMELYYR